MGLVGCSEDQAGDKARLTMEVVPCAPTFIEKEIGGNTRSWNTTERGTTRGWTTPDGYVTYDVIYGPNGMFATQKNLTNKSIKAFFTQDGQETKEGIFSYYGQDQNNKDVWRLGGMEIEQAGDFYLYGFIPSEVSESSSIAGNSSFSEGAVLTLNGIKTVTPSDVCVVIGAKNGSADYRENEDYSVTGLQPGSFLVAATASSLQTPGSGNYIFLLFDHLYSAMRFNFTVDATYDALRTIKLRKLEMIPYSDMNKTKVKAKYNATIRLKSNTTGALPITTATFTGDPTSDDAAFEPLFDGEVTLRPGEVTHYLGCFIPGDTKYFTLRSTYDVYDKKGNLIRQSNVAENYINLQGMLGTAEVLRGHMYSLTLMVSPTYLHVLSDPDLDNPKVIIGD